MATLTTSQLTEITALPLRKLAVRIARETELAVEKVAANYLHADQFPLTDDPNSIERIMLLRFESLHAKIKQAAALKAVDRINAPAEIRVDRFGDLNKVDLTTSIAIDFQVKTLPLPADLKLPPDYFGSAGVSGQQTFRAINSNITQQDVELQFRIHKVQCLDETDGFLGSEAGDDEIDLGGTAVDESGGTHLINPFRVGSDFDDGEQQIYSPPKTLIGFDLNDGDEFPKTYFVTLVLAEADMGGLPDFLNKLLNWVKDKVIEYLTTAIGAAIGASGGPIGAAIGAVIGAVVGWVISQIKEIWGDDVFKPGTVNASISALDARFDDDSSTSPQGFITYTGHGGTYRVTYDWYLNSDISNALVADNTIIYAVTQSGLDPRTGQRTRGKLLWYRLERRVDGSFGWANDSGNKVGTNWDFKQVFAGDKGIIYGIRDNNDLLWYQHQGQVDGSFRWGPASGKVVGNGWDFKQVLAAGEGVIYAIHASGDLLWYRHNGYRDGSFDWAPDSGKKVGNGWKFRHVFSGGDGVIYAVEDYEVDPRTGQHSGGQLLWYRHHNWRDGGGAWAESKKVGRGWNFKQVFGGNKGSIYAIDAVGDLLWFRHEGYSAGTFTWAESSGKPVGSSWDFKQLFTGI